MSDRLQWICRGRVDGVVSFSTVVLASLASLEGHGLWRCMVHESNESPLGQRVHHLVGHLPFLVVHVLHY